MKLKWLLAVLTTGMSHEQAASRKQDQYLAICLVVKHQNEDLREWVDYHVFMGVSKFYVFDDGGETDSAAGVLQDYIDSGLVYHENTETSMYGAQLKKYGLCIKRYADYHQWLAFIDVDEFIVVDDPHRTAADKLRNYEEYGGVGLNWLLYGSSGLDERPRGGVGNYYKCSRQTWENTHIKTIANTDHVREQGGHAHSFVYKDGYFAVSVGKNRITQTPPTNIDPPDWDGWHLNHYILKSRTDFAKKVKRGGGSGGKWDRNWDFFKEIDAKMTGDWRLTARRFVAGAGNS